MDMVGVDGYVIVQTSIGECIVGSIAFRRDIGGSRCFKSYIGKCNFVFRCMICLVGYVRRREL